MREVEAGKGRWREEYICTFLYAVLSKCALDCTFAGLIFFCKEKRGYNIDKFNHTGGRIGRRG